MLVVSDDFCDKEYIDESWKKELEENLEESSNKEAKERHIEL